MSTIKQFNHLLNSSDKNRFEFWKSYRHRLTSFLLECIDTKKYQNLIILGAGNLDDINLNEFSNLFNCITLSDIDKKALENAKKKYKLSLNKVKLQEEEYTGLNKSVHWNNFINKMLLYTTKSDIKQYFSILQKEIKNHRFIDNTTYDLIIVTPIYTQLLLQQMLNNISILTNLNYPKQLLDYIKSQALEIMPAVIQTFNMNVVNLLNIKGSLFVVSDIFEAKIDSKFYRQINPIIDNLEDMSNFYSNYVEKFGIGVGDYGLNLLIESLSIKKSHWFEWPFNLNKSIFVKAVYLNKDEEKELKSI